MIRLAVANRDKYPNLNLCGPMGRRVEFPRSPLGWGWSSYLLLRGGRHRWVVFRAWVFILEEVTLGFRARDEDFGILPV
jgi:hypothetical protein